MDLMDVIMSAKLGRGGGGGGTTDHSQLTNRDAEDQHPIGAITGLTEDLASKQEQIDAIVSKSDVVDVVDTYSDLLAYDTSTLAPNDIIKVLEDGSLNNAKSYYRWVVTEGEGDWDLVASESVNAPILRRYAGYERYLLPGSVYFITEEPSYSAFEFATPSYNEDFEVTFIATGVTSLSFTAPYGFILGDETGFAGLSEENTLTLSNLTATTIYELSFKYLCDNYIGMLMKEWPTA